MRLISSIRTHFDERKTAAAAGVLLKEAGGKMPYLRLIKLLYLADRESWHEFNRPITGDSYVAMKLGPVLSQTLDLVKSEPEPSEEGPWAKTIERAGYHVRLKVEPDLGPLSEAEIEILTGAFRLCAQMSQWKLSEMTHLFPEWSDPGNSSSPIWPEDILQALGKTDEEVEEARQLAAEDAFLSQLLGGESR